MTESERNDLIEKCAVAAEQQDRIGREWVGESLWAKILKRAGDNVRLLKTRPITSDAIGLSVLRQAIIDNTHGHLFWIGEMLLNELQKETGFPASEPSGKCGLSIEIDGSTVCRQCDYRTFNSETTCRRAALPPHNRSTPEVSS